MSEKTSGPPTLRRYPLWLKISLIGAFTTCAIAYQIASMFEYHRAMHTPVDQPIPREYRLGNYEGPRYQPQLQPESKKS